MTAPFISSDNDAIQSGGSAAADRQNATMSGQDTRGGGSVHPRLTAAVDDAREGNQNAADRNRDGIDRTKKDSAGKTDIDKAGARGVNGVGGLLRGALGAAGADLAGGAQSGAGASPRMAAPMASPMAAPMASPLASMMPSALPQFSAPTVGQSMPAALSNPAVARLVAALIGGDHSAVGVGGIAGAMAGASGGSGTAGPNSSGSNAFEQRVLSMARQVVAANLPYAWGGGTLNGPSQGISDGGGGADAAGDYGKVGFDCSGLARYLVYQASGIEIPRTSQAQFAAGMTISASDARPGDLLFPSYSGVPPGHVQIYVGDGKVVEAQRSGTTLMYSNAPAGTFKRFVSVS